MQAIKAAAVLSALYMCVIILTVSLFCTLHPSAAVELYQSLIWHFRLHLLSNSGPKAAASVVMHYRISSKCASPQMSS